MEKKMLAIEKKMKNRGLDFDWAKKEMDIRDTAA
jgi:hypothetical protein